MLPVRILLPSTYLVIDFILAKNRWRLKNKVGGNCVSTWCVGGNGSRRDTQRRVEKSSSRRARAAIGNVSLWRRTCRGDFVLYSLQRYERSCPRSGFQGGITCIRDKFILFIDFF